MRILFVVPNVPSPVRPRPLNFIRALSQGHDVSVLCVATNKADYQFVSELLTHCHSLEVVRLPRWQSMFNCLSAVLSSKSLRCAYFYSPSLRRSVLEKVSQGEVDLIHAEHLKSVPMLEDVLGKVPTVFDAVDCVSMFETKRRTILRNPLLRLFSRLEWRRMAHWEAKAYRLFNRILISSPIDKEHYSVSGQERDKIDVIPNAVDLTQFAYQQFKRQKDLLVFCAKLDYFPNQDAIEYFTRSVWPLLRARRPELRLQIVGSRPPRNVRQLNGKDNIQVVGFVPDVRPHLGGASVALCPIRLRAGTQFKILEAMALGVPVVATRICCPGLAVEAGKHILVADTPEEFVSTIELILDNEILRDKLSRAGREYIERHHNWNNSVASLCNVYAEAITDFEESREILSAACLLNKI